MMLQKRYPITTLIVVSLFLIGLCSLLYGFVLAPVSKINDLKQCFIFKKKQSFRQLIWDLHRRGLLQHPQAFLILSRLRGQSHHLQAGQYCITPDTSLWQLYSNLMQGRTHVYKITFIEGNDFSQVLQILFGAHALQHRIGMQSEPQVMRRIGHPQGAAEGMFFPTTYYFHWQDTDLSILKRAYHLMRQRIAIAWAKRRHHLPYHSPYEALIVASLIEKEAKFDEDRPKIARVILNRLQKGMRLQIDSTVMYALHQKNRKQRADFLSRSPYNTYKRTGLPVTPIAMPGVASIDAALHPAHTNDLYYVVREDGHHIFSERFLAHKKASEHYRKRMARLRKMRRKR